MNKSNKLPANVELAEGKFEKVYRYYSTDIIKIQDDNRGRKITLFTGGRYTKSTKKHMEKLLAREGVNVIVQFSIIYGYRVIYWKDNEEEIYSFDKDDYCDFYV